MSNQSGANHPFENWSSYDSYWQSNVRYLADRAEQALGYTVGYAQIYLKAMLLLNGGGIFLMPAFAQRLGSLWTTGLFPPVATITLFVAGVLAASAATACGFFEFLQLQEFFSAGSSRMATAINKQHQQFIAEKKLLPLDLTQSEKEVQSWNKSRWWDRLAIFFGWATVVCFILGSVGGVYIVGCGTAASNEPAACVWFK